MATDDLEFMKNSPLDGDEDGMQPIQPVATNNVRPACFSSTIQEVLFVLTATMAIAMGSLLSGVCINEENHRLPFPFIPLNKLEQL